MLEAARALTAGELLQGGVVENVHYDPVAYIVVGLQMRFGQLDDETRLASMSELLAFARRPGEAINALLTRYEIVRQRAVTEGNVIILAMPFMAGIRPDRKLIQLWRCRRIDQHFRCTMTRQCMTAPLAITALKPRMAGVCILKMQPAMFKPMAGLILRLPQGMVRLQIAEMSKLIWMRLVISPVQKQWHKLS